MEQIRKEESLNTDILKDFPSIQEVNESDIYIQRLIRYNINTLSIWLTNGSVSINPVILSYKDYDSWSEFPEGIHLNLESVDFTNPISIAGRRGITTEDPHNLIGISDKHTLYIGKEPVLSFEYSPGIHKNVSYEYVISECSDDLSLVYNGRKFKPQYIIYDRYKQGELDYPSLKICNLNYY